MYISAPPGCCGTHAVTLYTLSRTITQQSEGVLCLATEARLNVLTLDLGFRSSLRLNTFPDGMLLSPCIGWAQSSIAILSMLRLRGNPISVDSDRRICDRNNSGR